MDNKTRFDVFLSYNSKDKAEIELFAGWLRNENIRIWFDKWELRPGLWSLNKVYPIYEN